MHAVVVAGDGLDVEAAQSVDLQLEGQSRFKMAVDGILFKLERGEKIRAREGGRVQSRQVRGSHIGFGSEGEVFGEGSLLEEQECDPADPLLIQH